MTKGGKNPRRLGDAFEVEVVHDMERHGWDAMRLRQGGGEDVDIIALKGLYRIGFALPVVQMIQARLRGKMLKAEKEVLYLRAQNVHATAYLAYKRDGEIVYEELRE